MPEFITIGPTLVEIPVAVRADGDDAVRAFVASQATPAPVAPARQTPDRAPKGEEK